MDSIERILTDLFIALMLFILWAWDLPRQSLLNRLAMKLRWPIQRLGLFHGWQLFSPDPSIDNYRLQFKLNFADGSVVTIEPEYLRHPREQLQRVRYRWTKIKGSLLRVESGPLRASMCKYVAAEYLGQFAIEARHDKCPVEVQIVRWRQRIGPLEAGDSASCEPYKFRIIHTQPISQAPRAAAPVRSVKPFRLSLYWE
jgi:hypothetical protein